MTFAIPALGLAFRSLEPSSLRTRRFPVPNPLVLQFNRELKERRLHRFVQDIVLSYLPPENGIWMIRVRVIFHPTVPKHDALCFLESYEDDCRYKLDALLAEL